jgi:hypothetical protein
VKGEYSPRRCPEKKIVLALNAVYVREEAGHQSGGDQQRQGNETLMHQENIRFSARIADGLP